MCTHTENVGLCLSLWQGRLRGGQTTIHVCMCAHCCHCSVFSQNRGNWHIWHLFKLESDIPWANSQGIRDIDVWKHIQLYIWDRNFCTCWLGGGGGKKKGKKSFHFWIVCISCTAEPLLRVHLDKRPPLFENHFSETFQSFPSCFGLNELLPQGPASFVALLWRPLLLDC